MIQVMCCRSGLFVAFLQGDQTRKNDFKIYLFKMKSQDNLIHLIRFLYRKKQHFFHLSFFYIITKYKKNPSLNRIFLNKWRTTSNNKSTVLGNSTHISTNLKESVITIDEWWMMQMNVIGKLSDWKYYLFLA